MFLSGILRLSLPYIIAGKVLSGQEFAKARYDYVVVGGGTAGLVVAARLSEIPSIRVGIIEAGEYLPDDERINSPQGSGYLANPKYDWMFQSVPQENVNGREIFLARGKILGGSSAINAMIWQRPSKAEIDFWETDFQNGPEWNFDSLLPYFKKSESWTPPTLLYPGQKQSNVLATSMGLHGPLNISYNTWETDVSTPVVVSGNNLGVFSSSDQFSGNATGFGQIPRTVNPDTGVRSYAANAYYGPNAERDNLDLVTSAQVTRLVFDERRVATGVEYVVGGTTFVVGVEREVVLSAGALQTPQILELSGVGKKSLLEAFGIPIVVDLPDVGENLQDHPVSLIDVEIKPGVITLDELRNNVTYLKEQQGIFATSRTGALSETAPVLGPTTLQSFVSQERLDAMLANLDSLLQKQDANQVPPIRKVQYELQRNVMLHHKGMGWTEFTMVPQGGLAAPPEKGKSYTTVVAIELLPFSRGSTHIKSADALAPPAVDPRFLEVPFDADVLAEGTRFLQRWMQTSPMLDLVAAQHMPPETLGDDDEVLSYVRRAMQTTNHPLGTTAMAPRELGGVVDSQLKVYGLENVRVVDGGIIPMITGVAILSLVYAIGEKASDMIKQDYFAASGSGGGVDRVHGEQVTVRLQEL